jgi:hypothetical protein
MKKLNGLLLAGVALCLAASSAWGQQRAQVQAAPQLQQAQVAPAPTDQNAVTANAVLSATETWRQIATGLRTGGRLQITASGQWRVSPQINRNTDVAVLRALAQDAGPDGYVDLPRSDSVILPSAPVAALIGRIGENGAPFLIGSQYNDAIASDGDLFVTINDAPGQLQDNSGRLSIQAGVTPPPPPPEAPQETPQEQSPGAEPGAEQPAISPELIRAGLIGAGILLGLLILTSLFRSPRGGSNDRRNPAVPQVTTRVVNDGVAGQSLTLTLRRR